MRMAAPIGTLTRKIVRHPAAWVSTPPATVPTDAPAAPVKLKTAMARARSAASG